MLVEIRREMLEAILIQIREKAANFAVHYLKMFFWAH